MEGAALLERLAAWARESGIEVRDARRAPAGECEPGLRSAACRVQGRIWVVLVPDDPLDVRIHAVADALDLAAPGWLEAHWLPPAVRARLEARARRPA